MELLHHDKERFAEAIALTVYQTGIAAEIVEKDYYLTMILYKLAQRAPYVVFKGGTSLSKCFNIINRFSEDIDITVDIPLTQGQRKKLKHMLVEIVNEIGLRISNLEETRSGRNYNRYEIEYESVNLLQGNIVAPVVVLEISLTVIAFPIKEMYVNNLIGKMLVKEAPELINAYQLEPFQMKVQGIERTFIDKVFAICDYYLEDKVKNHSRHIYDVYKLFPAIEQNNLLSRLIRRVREARAETDICPSSRNDVDISQLLYRIIDEQAYRLDYESVTMKLLEDNVSYWTAIETLKCVADSGLFD